MKRRGWGGRGRAASRTGSLGRKDRRVEVAGGETAGATGGGIAELLLG